jgi:predicted MFS family arabinose efflux permease
LKTPDSIATTPNPARTVLILSLAPAIGLGIGRFAYSLVLPDMRESLHWSYSTAGFMNTVNAAGYLAGALGGAAFVRRFGLFRTLWFGVLMSIASLILCALTGNFLVLSFARILVGFGAAISFVGGGALAATIAQKYPERSALLLSLFYTGPGLGLIVSGLASPFLLQHYGPGSWWIVWAALAVISALMAVPLIMNPLDTPPGENAASTAPVALKPMMIFLVAYFLFGAGYIAYMTFMIAYVRDAGGDAAAQSAFWCLIGISAFASPWVWRRLMSRGDSGRTIGIIMSMLTIGAALAMIGTSPFWLAASALVFGNSFFAVVTATTAFSRLNYPPDAWPKVIGIMTITFGLGQTIGPFLTGAITDATGSLSYALNFSVAVLALGALLAFFQKSLRAR